MSTLVQLGLADGGEVSVEVAEPDQGVGPAGRRDPVGSAVASLEAALVPIRGAASSALRVLRESEIQPDEVQLEFSVKLTAEASAVIARSTVEGQFLVRVAWRREQAAPATLSPAGQQE